MPEFDPTLTDRFERLEIAPHDFWHADHVQVAFEMLQRYDFLDACTRYANTIRTMARNAGAPNKFNTTITIAFMSLVAERMAHQQGAELSGFFADNADLLDKNVLGRWYSSDRITSALARRQFLMPDNVTFDELLARKSRITRLPLRPNSGDRFTTP